jgi:hypothetical protein
MKLKQMVDGKSIPLHEGGPACAGSAGLPGGTTAGRAKVGVHVSFTHAERTSHATARPCGPYCNRVYTSGPYTGPEARLQVLQRYGQPQFPRGDATRVVQTRQGSRRRDEGVRGECAP